MRRMALACLSLVFLLLVSRPILSAREIRYDTPAWIKGYGGVFFVDHTPDNRRILLSTTSGLYLLDPQTPDAAPLSLVGHSDVVRSATFSPDGSLMATTSFDGTVRLWHMPDGQAVWNARVSDPCCTGKAPLKALFTDDASLLVVALNEHYPAGAYVINVHSGKAQPVDSNVIPYMALIHGSDLVYAKQEDVGFRVWRLHAEGDDIVQSAVVSLPDVHVPADYDMTGEPILTDDYAVVPDRKGTLVYINLNSGAKPAELTDFPLSVFAFGNTIWGTTGSKLSVANLDTGKRLDLPLKLPPADSNRQWLSYVDDQGLFSLLDLKTLDHVSVVSDTARLQSLDSLIVYVEGKSLKLFNAVGGKTVTLDGAIIPDGDSNLFIQAVENKVLVSYGSDPAYIGLWDATSGASIVPPTAYNNLTPYLSVIDKGRVAILGQEPSSGDTGIVVADLNVGSLRFYPTQMKGQPRLFVGNQVLYAAPDFALIDLTTGVETRFASEASAGSDLAFSPDGKTLATGGSDRTVRLWDADTGLQTGVLGLQDAAWRLAYGEQGVAVLYTDNQLHFVNIPPTNAPTNTVSSSKFLYDIALQGNIIAAASDGEVTLFAVDANGSISLKSSLIPSASLPTVSQYRAVAMSNRYIAAASVVSGGNGLPLETIVDLWSATTHKFVKRLDSQISLEIYNLAFSLDGTHMALTGGYTVVWNLARSLDEPSWLLTNGGNAGSTFAGDMLAILNQGWLVHSVDLYSVSNGTYGGTLRRNVNSTEGGGGDGYPVPITASPDGMHIALFDARGELVMWKMPDQVERVAEEVMARKANVIPYCDSLGVVAVNPTRSQPVNLTWSWFATDLSHLEDHMLNAAYEISLDGSLLPRWQFQRSSINRDKINNNNWTIYYSIDVGLLKPGLHRLTYRLSWKMAISDGINDYGPNTAHPEETGTCTFTVN